MVTDQDLVYLGGKSVYESWDDEPGTSVNVNGKLYELIEKNAV